MRLVAGQRWALKQMVANVVPLRHWPAVGWAPALTPSRLQLGLLVPVKAITSRQMIEMEMGGYLARSMMSFDPTADGRVLTNEGWVLARELLSVKARKDVPPSPPQGYGEKCRRWL